MSEHEELLMECAECAELVAMMSDCLDSEETVEMRQELMTHIQTCEHCARLYWKMKRLIVECRCEERVQVPDATHRQLWHVLVREIRIRHEGPSA